MTGQPSRWDDLRPRLMTAVVLLVVGIGAIWLGGVWFACLAAAVAGIMTWELSLMLAPERAPAAVQSGMLAAAAVLFSRVLPEVYVLPVLAAALLVGLGRIPRERLIYGAYGAAILLATYGLVRFRDEDGMLWLVWLILVVVVTDVGGYFGGRLIGGRKFWPRVSPKKTWAGILSGWAAAAIVGTGFAFYTTAGFDLVWITMLVSFASQMGDVAESAIKRRAGVKDSSKLLPGHGGLADRFDALLGAALLMLAFAMVLPVPEVAYPGARTIPAPWWPW